MPHDPVYYGRGVRRVERLLASDMYPQFFGLDKLPFRLRPDPDFLYAGDGYMRARAQLITALRSEARAVLLMGPPGVGKTLLLEALLSETSGQFAVCRINQPHLPATALV